MSTYTMTSPTVGGELPAGITAVGGIVLDLIGINGVRITAQLSAASLFSGFSSSSILTIGTQTGFTPAMLAALGGGLAEVAIRVTLYDGDTGPGEFDFNQNWLLLDGINVGSFTRPTERTTADGNFISSGTGFGNNILSTGWWHITASSTLEAIYNALADGSLAFQLQDSDPGDNFYDFTQGVSGGLVNVGQPPVVVAPNGPPVVAGPVTSETNEDEAGYSVDLLTGASDPDGHTLSVTGLTLVSGNAGGITLSGNALAVDPSAYNYLKAGESEIVTYSYTIDDGNGGTVVQTATITIEGRNDAPSSPVDTDAIGDDVGTQRASVSEHLAVGSYIGITAQAVDPEGDPVEYYFKDADGNRTQTLGQFTINALTGQVTLAAALNFELATSHSLTIYAGDGSLESSTTFTVNVENVVENLFTSGNDNVDFNLLGPGAYDIDGAEYDALAGDDLVVLPSLATSARAGHAWNYATIFRAGAGNDMVTGRDGDDRISGGLGNDLLRGGEGNDTLWGDEGEDVLYGEDGDDTLHGGDGADQLYGGAGNDTINGDGGNDTIWGGFGNDTIDGGAGNDLIHGEDGDDTIDGGAGADSLYGGAGNDTIRGGADNDLIHGGLGNDLLVGGNGADLLYGEDGDDYLYGGAGADHLDGGGGNDRLFGGDGDDRLVGGSGDDILAGGAGSDKLTGGSGKDIFIFTRTEIGTSKRGEHDVITDFQQGTDKIDISALYGGGAYNGLKNGALSGRATDAYKVGYYSESGKTWLEGDIDGDGRADFVIEMTGAYKLTGSDLLVSASLVSAQDQWATATGGLDYNHFHTDSLWL
ncbi:MAG TPA: Ig-like domain-containing protein [Sphingomicrobium sp.]|nr:Ig-like domain-containing protein [Sphingomicrobium sp.]